MILGAKIPIFSAIPATVYGYAATVALTLLTADGLANLSVPSLVNPAVIIALSMIGGNIFGLDLRSARWPSGTQGVGDDAN